MAPVLRAVSGYRSDYGEWPEGREDHVSEEMAARLLRDSPESFEVVESGAAPKQKTSVKPTPAGPPPASGTEAVDLDTLNIPQLRALAKERGVDLTGLRTLLDIRNAIERAESVPGEPGESPEGGSGPATPSDSEDEDEDDGEDDDEDDE